ncbi:MAG: hypothetical protein Q7J73_03750, partial [Dehalococcoidales bacterium]|nr:hypothetical protein [Dehalococcoidales bacterium]
MSQEAPRNIIHPRNIQEVPLLRRLKTRAVFAAGGAVTLTSAFLAACGGGGEVKAVNPDSTVLPVQTAQVTPTETPRPAVTATATEAPKAAIPAEAQQFLNDINSISSITPEQREAIRKGFVERDWPNATTERKKYSAYAGLYSTFTAGWNVTKDP